MVGFHGGFDLFLIHWGHSRTIMCKEGQRNLIHMLLLETQKVSSEAGGCQPKFTFDLGTRSGSSSKDQTTSGIVTQLATFKRCVL